MTNETRAALRDRQTKVDAYVSKRGQIEARRYLTQRREPQIPVDLLTLMAVVYVAASVLFAYLLG